MVTAVSYTHLDVYKRQTGALAVSGRLLEGEAGAATPPIDKDLDGVIEMHVHADPDVRARCIDQLTLTRQCKQNGYRGIMYKCHDFITNDIAYLLRATVPGIEVFGGIALNRNYGDTVNVQDVYKRQGLAIIRNSIEQCGGSVFCANEKPRGFSVTMIFPCGQRGE